MKFVHMADCHIGGWREPKLREISVKAFGRVIDESIRDKVDFILISGDLFNTSLPSIDKLKEVVIKLKELKDKDIPVYLVAGSHDFSPSGKTMLDVLEHAGLFINVATGTETDDNKLRLNFTVDKKTGAKITGLLGKKGGLEKSYYHSLDRHPLESEPGFKIFMFHSALSEYKPEEMKDMEAEPLSILPKNFNYYAGGHVHYVFEKDEDGYGKIVYPGPLFPNNFSEIEKLKSGGYYFVEVKDNKIQASHRLIQVYNTVSIPVKCDRKSPAEIELEIIDLIRDKELLDTIVTLRLEGKMTSGKPSDINMKGIFELLYEKQAYFVMKNTNKLVSEEFEEIKIGVQSSDDVESALIKEHLQQIKVDGLTPEREDSLIRGLMRVLEFEKQEGEKVYDFERRLKSELGKVFEF